MYVENQLLKSLLDGTISSEDRKAIQARLEDAQSGFLYVVSWDNKYGCELLSVRTENEVTSNELKRLLSSFKPAHFEFHSRDDEFINAMMLVSDLENQTAVDLRAWRH